MTDVWLSPEGTRPSTARTACAPEDAVWQQHGAVVAWVPVVSDVLMADHQRVGVRDCLQHLQRKTHRAGADNSLLVQKSARRCMFTTVSTCSIIQLHFTYVLKMTTTHKQIQQQLHTHTSGHSMWRRRQFCPSLLQFAAPAGALSRRRH